MNVLKLITYWLAIPVVLFAAGWLAGTGSGGTDTDRKAIPGNSVDRELLRKLAFYDLSDARGPVPASAQRTEGLAIDLGIDPDTFAMMRIHQNRKTYKRRRQNIAVRFGDNAPQPAILRLRGITSLAEKGELNFKIQLLDAWPFDRGVLLKSFYLMNMVYDEHDYRMVLGFRVLAKLGLNPCYFQYVKVSVNGEPIGMMLMIEPPRVAIRRLHPDTVGIFRRVKRNVYQDDWVKSVPYVHRQIRLLRKLNNRQDVTRPMHMWGELVDLDAYFTWTAVNSILKNSDTLDELIFYEVRADRNVPEPLRVMGWDYDDLMLREGRSDSIVDPLMFACRDTLDLRIQQHPALYKQFREVLYSMLAETLPADAAVAELRATQELRNRLDDGRAQGLQVRDRRARDADVDEFEKKLRARYAELLAALEER